MITAAELDPEPFTQQFDLLKAACRKADGCARAFMLPQHITCRKSMRSTPRIRG